MQYRLNNVRFPTSYYADNVRPFAAKLRRMLVCVFRFIFAMQDVGLTLVLFVFKVGRNRPGHFTLQRTGHLGGDETVPIPRNAGVQVGVHQGHSFHFGQNQASRLAVHAGELDSRPLVS